MSRKKNIEKCCDGCFIDICRCACLLNVSVVTARKILGTPDFIRKNKYNLPQHFYAISRIEKAVSERKEKSEKPVCECCRRCHTKCKKCDLIGGRCMQCRADLCVFNFCSCGKLPFGEQNPRMIECLKNALAKAESGVDHV